MATTGKEEKAMVVRKYLIYCMKMVRREAKPLQAE
jgi:hypothetical protein